MISAIFRRASRKSVTKDANAMIQALGESAFAAAGDMAWKEDAGLIIARYPGHWSRVQIEIGNQTGQSLGEMDRRVRCGRCSDSSMA